VTVAYGAPAVHPHYDLGVEPRQLADPGLAGRIAPTSSAYVLLTSVMAETRTLSDPLYAGQELDLFFETDIGDVVITADSAINQAGNTIMTFADGGDHIRLLGARDGTAGAAWRVVANDGVALS
jgi:hypothetical protein